MAFIQLLCQLYTSIAAAVEMNRDRSEDSELETESQSSDDDEPPDISRLRFKLHFSVNRESNIAFRASRTEAYIYRTFGSRKGLRRFIRKFSDDPSAPCAMAGARLIEMTSMYFIYTPPTNTPFNFAADTLMREDDVEDTGELEPFTKSTETLDSFMSATSKIYSILHQGNLLTVYLKGSEYPVTNLVCVWGFVSTIISMVAVFISLNIAKPGGTLCSSDPAHLVFAIVYSTWLLYFLLFFFIAGLVTHNWLIDREIAATIPNAPSVRHISSWTVLEVSEMQIGAGALTVVFIALWGWIESTYRQCGV